MRCDWRECTLSDLGEIVGGATPSTKNPENYGGNIAWITPKDLSNFPGRFISRGERNITEAGLKSCSARLMPKNTILFSSRAPIGYIAIAANELCTNQGFKSIIPNDDTDFMFLYYLLKYNKDAIERLSNGTTFREVSGSVMKNITVCVPKSKREQQKIASILSPLDDKIDLNRRINANLEEQARAIFKHWFIDREPSEKWREGKLKDILILKRNNIKASEKQNLPYLPMSVIPMRSFAVHEVKPNDEAHSSLVTFSRDDIIIGAIRIYFHRVVLAPFDGITHTTCFTLRPFNDDYLSFCLLLCDQDSTIKYAENTSTGTTMPCAVWNGGLGDMDIIIPDKNTAREFNDIVLPILRKIQASYNENNTLANIRDSLIHKLISGEIIP